MNDETLLLFIDGEAEPATRREMRLHLRRCSTCRGEAHRLRDLTRSFDAALPGLDPLAPESLLPASFQDVRSLRGPGGRNDRGGGWMRAAAVALLLAAAGAAAVPLGAALVRWIAEPSLPTEQAPSGAPLDGAPLEAASPEYRFVPASGELRVIFEVPTGGELHLRRTLGSAAVLEIEGQGGGQILVLPEEVRIAGPARAGVNYLLSLPESVHTLLLHTAGGDVLRLSNSGVEQRIRLP